MTSNVTSINSRNHKARRLDWLARGIEAQMKNEPNADQVAVILDRESAILLVRQIDAINKETRETP